MVDEEKRATLRRFATIGGLGIASSSGEATASDSLPRDAIMGYVSETPGVHFSKLRDDLHLGTGETQHHLRRLEKADEIETRRDGDYKRFFRSNEFSKFEKRILGYLRRETPRRLLIALLRQPESTGSELAERCSVSQGTVSNWMTALSSDSIIERESGYRLTRPETVMILLIQYADSFGHRARALAADAQRLLTYDPESTLHVVAPEYPHF
ncbi:MAG: winged helix-turn-helix transcriptional regulator, partial [Halobacteriaceae archaeon]